LARRLTAKSLFGETLQELLASLRRAPEGAQLGLILEELGKLFMRSSCTLRRISWALGVPMTQGIEFLFEYLPQILDREKICQGCRDRTKCPQCAFQPQSNAPIPLQKLPVRFSPEGLRKYLISWGFFS
jgi:hypothetical protein